MAFLFEKLDVYQLALEFYNKVLALFKNHSFHEHRHLKDHLDRASLSISLNIAEGNGRYHKGDRRNFFLISRGSAFECIAIRTICKSNKILPDSSVAELREDLERISKMLSGMINAANARG